MDLGSSLGILNWPLRCPACLPVGQTGGAPLDRRKEQCEYCRTPVRRVGPVRVEDRPTQPGATRVPARPGRDPEDIDTSF